MIDAKPDFEIRFERERITVQVTRSNQIATRQLLDFRFSESLTVFNFTGRNKPRAFQNRKITSYGLITLDHQQGRAGRRCVVAEHFLRQSEQSSFAIRTNAEADRQDLLSRIAGQTVAKHPLNERNQVAGTLHNLYQKFFNQ